MGGFVPAPPAPSALRRGADVAWPLIRVSSLPWAGLGHTSSYSGAARFAHSLAGKRYEQRAGGSIIRL